MALFHAKKKKEKKKESKHQFPDFSDHNDLPEFPSKTADLPEFATNDREPPKEDPFDFSEFSESTPAEQNKPVEMSPQDMPLTQESNPILNTVAEPIPIQEPSEPNLAPSAVSPTGDQRTFFVKIDKYEQAVDLLKQIKELTEDAGNVLTKLKDIKQKEDQDITQWETQLEQLNSKLLAVDSALFQDQE
ncbi:hypothetical protein CL622_01050 [archaeon]|nr:hypothetical protein [archaeon]|tara:strand:- start:3241 stop:3807 length:567 start_codon:yes stop_codon:yes gene_type:complete